jgi:hypothetical protein
MTSSKGRPAAPCHLASEASRLLHGHPWRWHGMQQGMGGGACSTLRQLSGCGCRCCRPRSRRCHSAGSGPMRRHSCDRCKGAAGRRRWSSAVHRALVDGVCWWSEVGLCWLCRALLAEGSAQRPTSQTPGSLRDDRSPEPGNTATGSTGRATAQLAGASRGDHCLSRRLSPWRCPGCSVASPLGPGPSGGARPPRPPPGTAQPGARRGCAGQA